MERRDLRVVKTTKILNAAMFSLLERYSFRKITVRDICNEAQISRATFYARFMDKYDFLKSWLINLVPDNLNRNKTFEEISEICNDSFYKNKTVIKNIFIDVDCETLEILARFILNYFMQTDEYDTEQVVLSNFFAGGMIFYIMQQVKNRIPPTVNPVNMYLYELIKKFLEWENNAL